MRPVEGGIDLRGVEDAGVALEVRALPREPRLDFARQAPAGGADAGAGGSQGGYMRPQCLRQPGGGVPWNTGMRQRAPCWRSITSSQSPTALLQRPFTYRAPAMSV